MRVLSWDVGIKNLAYCLIDNSKIIDWGIINLLEDSSIENSSKSSDNLVMIWRRIGTGSQILRDLGVQKMKVIGQKHKYHAISGFGLEVIEHIQLSKINENESS